MYVVVLVLVLLIFYFVVMLDKVYLFIGWEEIWCKFYEILGEKIG